MLDDPKEIQIISRAKQKNVRDPNRSRLHFDRIFKDFLSRVNLDGTVLLDLGPGQYDFGVLARQRGATTYGVDKDPAVCELGRYKGFSVKEDLIENLRPQDFDFQFDGIFCKFSISAFWFGDDQAHRAYIAGLCQLIKPRGWAWIGPWNGAPGGPGASAKLAPDQIEHKLSVQSQAFLEQGFWGVELTAGPQRYYGIYGATANAALFCLNLKRPRRLWRCRKYHTPASPSSRGS